MQEADYCGSSSFKRREEGEAIDATERIMYLLPSSGAPRLFRTHGLLELTRRAIVKKGQCSRSKRWRQRGSVLFFSSIFPDTHGRYSMRRCRDSSHSHRGTALYNTISHELLRMVKHHPPLYLVIAGEVFQHRRDAGIIVVRSNFSWETATR